MNSQSHIIPIKTDMDLQEAIIKKQRVSIQQLQKHILFLEKWIKDNGSSHKIMVSTESEVFFIDTKSISYVEADGGYAHIHIDDGTCYLVSKSLKKVIEQIHDTSFVRIHATYYVNFKFISKYQKSKNIIVLFNMKELPVSRSRRDDLLSRYISNSEFT